MDMSQIGQVLQGLASYFNALGASEQRSPVALPAPASPFEQAPDAPPEQAVSAVGARNMHPLMEKAYAFAALPQAERLQWWLTLEHGVTFQRVLSGKVLTVPTIEGGTLLYLDGKAVAQVKADSASVGDALCEFEPFEGIEVVRRLIAWDRWMVAYGLRALCTQCDVTGPHVTWFVGSHGWGDWPVVVAADGSLLQVSPEGTKSSESFAYDRSEYDEMKQTFEHACVANFKRKEWILLCK